MYSLLASNKLKGEISELLVAHLLRRKGFLVYRPEKLLMKIRRLKLPESYEVEFLREHSKTMDFFAIFPESNAMDSREVVFQLFSCCGLKRYFERPEHQGFVVEVKSGSAELSPRQRGMIRQAQRLGFKSLIAHVRYSENYWVDVSFRVLDGGER